MASYNNLRLLIRPELMQTCINNTGIQSQGTLSSLSVSPNVKEKPRINALLLMAGQKGHRRLRHACSIRAASGQAPREPAAPSAPPLPRELRTSERIKYPEAYGEDQYTTGQPGLREDQGPVDQSVFETDQVQVSFPIGVVVAAECKITQLPCLELVYLCPMHMQPLAVHGIPLDVTL